VDTARKSRLHSILLVDDDPDCRMLVRDVVAECEGIGEIREAGSGEEAMRLLARRGAVPPALVYCDLEMPGMTGLDVVRAIKTDPALRGVVVVILSGLDDEGRKRQAAALGADGYEVKHTDPRTFRDRVRRITLRWLGAGLAGQSTPGRLAIGARSETR